MRAEEWSLDAQWRRLRACDAVIIPSLQDSIKQVKSANRMVEALWAGRPAVARNHVQYDRLCAGLGVAGWDRFRVVDWPMLRPAIGLALGLTSAASMGDLAAIALFGNQDLTNLTLLLYNQISAYRMDSASGTALVLLALCLATFALIERGIGGRRRSLVLS